MTPYYQDELITLYHADSFDILPSLAGCHAVITDPPYMIGAKSVGIDSRDKQGSWVDIMNASHWYRAWMSACWDQIIDGGYLLSFCNWRSLPMVMHACALADIAVHSCAVWDKEWIGPAYHSQLRPRYEMIIFCGKGDCRIEDRAVSDIFRCKWMAGNCGIWHPAEKPLMLMCELVSIVTKPGETVVDPFSGGGTTLCAAKMSGRFAIGCEANEQYAEASARRIEQVALGSKTDHISIDNKRYLQNELF